jgi:hypothetical protein
LWKIIYCDGTVYTSNDCSFLALPRDKEVDSLQLITEDKVFVLKSPDKKFRFIYNKVGYQSLVDGKTDVLEEIGMYLENDTYVIVDSNGNSRIEKKSPQLRQIFKLNV